MKRYITEQYLPFELAEILEEKLEFSSTVSPNIPMPRYDKYGCILEPKIGPLEDGHYYCPPLSIVQTWLREIYHVHVEATISFGEKLGYDSWEVLGYRPFIGEEDESGLVFLEYDDLDMWRQSYKYCTLKFGEEYWIASGSLINKSYSLCLLEALEDAILMLTREGVHEMWKSLRLKRRETFIEDNLSFSPYIWFQSYYGDCHSLMALDSKVDETTAVYKSCLDCEDKASVLLEYKFGDYIVSEASIPVYIGKKAIPLEEGKDYEIIKGLIEKHHGNNDN